MSDRSHIEVDITAGVSDSSGASTVSISQTEIVESSTIETTMITGGKGEKGERGEKGDQGDRGEKGDTGEPGPQGEQGVQGLKGDKGDKGDPGAQGIQGIQGATGPKGDKGDKGDVGAAATVTVGSVTTGGAGTSASVTNSGTSSAAVLDFTIPRGDTGTVNAHDHDDRYYTETETDTLLNGKANATHTHVATTDLTATGTKSSATYLRGDNTWATPTNTTYSEITTAEIDAGTASTARTITGRRAQYIVDKARTGLASTADLANKVTGTMKITVSSTAPSSPAAGDIWIDTGA